MQKQPHCQIRIIFFQHFGKQKKLIIMYPYDIFFSDKILNRLAKSSVHPSIGFPGSLVIFRYCIEVMEQRPDCIIAESVVKTVHFFLSHENRNTLVSFSQNLPCFFLLLSGKFLLQNTGQPIQSASGPFMISLESACKSSNTFNKTQDPCRFF